MTELICKPFRENHADIFECQPAFLQQFKISMPLLVSLGQIDQCGSHMIDGRILYVGGWYEAAPGVAEMYIYPSVYTQQYAKTFFKEARWWVQHLKRQYRRVQCWGEDTELSRRWLKRIGFELEGVLNGFCENGSAMLVWGASGV